VDLEAFHASELSRAIRDVVMQNIGAEFEQHVARFGERYGLDPLKDIKSITLYGAGTDDGDAVAIVVTTPKLDGMLERVRGLADYGSESLDGFTLHKWRPEAGAEQPLAWVHTPAGDVDERVVVISSERARLRRAIGVVLGAQPNLTHEPRPSLARTPQHGSFFFLEAGGGMRDISRRSPMSRFAEKARSLTVEAGEVGGRFFVRSEVETKDAADARNIGDFLRGGLALGRMWIADRDLPLIASDLLEAVDIEVTGQTVAVSLSFESRTLVEELSAEAQEWRARRGEGR
jgi:hypothetical protein